MEIDYELLKQSDITFPLIADNYGMYIFDSKNEMIAQFESKSYFEFAKTQICGELRTFKNEESLDCYELNSNLDFINKLFPKDEIGCVRCWGHLQYKYNLKKGTRKYDSEGGIKRQDNLAAYLLKCLNTPKNNL